MLRHTASLLRRHQGRGVVWSQNWRRRVLSTSAAQPVFDDDDDISENIATTSTHSHVVVPEPTIAEPKQQDLYATLPKVGPATEIVQEHPSPIPAVPDFQFSTIPLINVEDELKKAKVYFVLGGPGSGKGTQCERLSKDYGLMHMSTGDLMRAEVQRGSRRGKFLDGMMREGQLIPLDITIELIRDAMRSQPKATGYLIDGFPRQMEQAQVFEQEVVPCQQMLYFVCQWSTMQKRLLNRGLTSGRCDDNIETIKKRFDTFYKISLPVIDHYKNNGKVLEICAERAPDEVYGCVSSFFLKNGYTRKSDQLS
eukprot:Colp12_sorted_trinity150504_noHs@12603